MANVQHLYRGVGDPNDNPDLDLTGDAVGNHLYQDSNNAQLVWISTTYEGQGGFYHEGWERLILETDLSIPQVEVNEPRFEGQIGLRLADGSLFIAMKDPDSDFATRWRSTGITLGDWYTPLT